MNPQTAKVVYCGTEYFPEKYVMWFNKDGETKNTARIISCKGFFAMEAKLEDIEEI